MLSKGFKIVSPKTFEIYYEDVELKQGYALVRIDTAAVCKADLRYFLGKRDKKVLGLKYPMRLLHEATGTILKDTTNTLKCGDKVVLVPNITECSLKDNNEICSNNQCMKKCYLRDMKLGENYCPKAKFVSSNMDGFSCEYIAFPINNLVPVNRNVSSTKSVFAELTSVGMAAIRKFNEDLNNKVIAIWGDGSLGYIICSILKTLTNSRIIVIGRHEEKLSKFPCDKYYFTDSTELFKENIQLAFECVGSKGSEGAIDEIIDNIVIGGKIMLTGVSESNIAINTRKILEKGIILTGTTRSSIEDFRKSIDIMENTKYTSYLEELIRDIRNIENINDYYDVFEEESKSTQLGKIIMKFHI